MTPYPVMIQKVKPTHTHTQKKCNMTYPKFKKNKIK